MTDDDPTTRPTEPTPDRRRAVIIGSIAGGVVVLGVITALVVSVAANGPTATDPSGSPTASASTSASASPSASPSAAPSESSAPATPDERFGLPVASEVPSTESATVAGATVSIDSITVEEASGTRAGETAGPAARVVVRIANPAGGADLDLSSVAVRAYTGQDLVPAAPIGDEAGFTGTMAPGEAATGTYLFTIPEGAEGSVTVTVGVTADSGLVVFTP